MKELTIEEKAKRYDEAIERARALNNGEDINVEAGTTTYEYIFPELKESEDERIRKELIDFVKSRLAGFPDYDRFIAWLEEQGKQKTIWHSEDEEPKRDSLILLIMQSGNAIVAKIIEPNHTFNHGERWAYIDDLLEKQGKEPVWTDNDRIMAFTLLRDVEQMTHISNEGKNERLKWLNTLEDRLCSNNEYAKDMLEQ